MVLQGDQPFLKIYVLNCRIPDLTRPPERRNCRFYCNNWQNIRV